MISLTRRLALGLLAAGLVVMFLLAHGSVLLFDRAFRDYLGSRLQEDAQSLMKDAIDRNGKLNLASLPFRGHYNQVYSGHYFSLQMDRATDIRSRSLWDKHLPEVAPGLSRRLVPGPEEQQLLVWSGTFRQDGHRFDITTALDYTSVADSLNWLRFSIWMLGGLLAILLVVIQQHVIRIVLAPLGQVRKELELLNDGHRLQIETPVPVEIAPVVNELNHQLERIERVLTRSRDGISNLGHALKTPIAVMEAQLARREFDQLPELRDALAARLADIHRLVQCELQRARLDTRNSSHKSHFQPEQELPPLISTLAEIYPHIAFHYSTEQAPSTLPWESEDMLEVLGNLLDNAGKWANAQARLTLRQQQENIEFIVEDDGPGIAPHKRAQVLNRGTRLDERVSGHGLGLGIVEQVVSFHGGRLYMAESSLGGLKAVIQLPLSPNGPK
ncbi:sensor histidine kinase [Carnimonas nigrificans]|uniref:sensor histidine kinase n=1 Tax=Carnimonas nigrificans TaxID=64323 RepID=UPI00046E9397|nr:sensor histidine kinase [Carnimonas nigrificans]